MRVPFSPVVGRESESRSFEYRGRNNRLCKNNHLIMKDRRFLQLFAHRLFRPFTTLFHCLRVYEFQIQYPSSHLRLKPSNFHGFRNIKFAFPPQRLASHFSPTSRAPKHPKRMAVTPEHPHPHPCPLHPGFSNWLSFLKNLQIIQKEPLALSESRKGYPLDPSIGRTLL